MSPPAAPGPCAQPHYQGTEIFLLEALCIDKSGTQVLERLVVEVTAYAASLSFPYLLQPLLCLLALDGRGQHVGYSLQKVDVILREGTVSCCVHPQHPEGSL